MTLQSVSLGADSSWHRPGARTAAAALLLTVAVSVTSRAHAAGQGEWCGRIGEWSESCDAGLECDVGWTFRRWNLGRCVASERRCGGDLPTQCSEREYCAFEPGVCGFADEPGVCKPRPDACTEEYAPVCGCDRVTYGNACAANAAGVSVQLSGECPECTSDEDCLHGICDIGVSCAGLNCPPPPPNRCTVCGDGSQLLCKRALTPCPDPEQVREIVDSCYGRCVDRASCEPT